MALRTGGFLANLSSRPANAAAKLPGLSLEKKKKIEHQLYVFAQSLIGTGLDEAYTYIRKKENGEKIPARVADIVWCFILKSDLKPDDETAAAGGNVK